MELQIKILSLGIGLKDNFLYIVDIRFKQNNKNLLSHINTPQYKIVSLTPYSSYLLQENNLHFNTIHDYISIDNFYDKVLLKYKLIENIFKESKEYSFLFRDFAFIITYEVYLAELLQILAKHKEDDFKIIYITDAENQESQYVENLQHSDLLASSLVDNIIKLNSKNEYFYKQNNLRFFLKSLMRKELIIKGLNKFILKNKFTMFFNYDNKFYRKIYENFIPLKTNNYVDGKNLEILLNTIRKNIIFDTTLPNIARMYNVLLEKTREQLSEKNFKDIKIRPFTFLSKNEDNLDVLKYRTNDIPIIFMQHGSYVNENIFLKYNEIFPADMNFVFNEYTKKLFEKRGAKSVCNVGSIGFNYPIKTRKIQYDFVYIIYCTSYGHTGTHIFSENDRFSIDGDDIYKKHELIINLFGNKFKKKRLCVKVQPGIFTGTMWYIPLLEISELYPNITIEFIKPLSKVIEVSKYIISDYFSSEFINREIHYKKDIIMFKNFPVSLPRETINDMEKMFILVDTIDELEDKIRNIELITNNRKRDDSVIEYYSSKKCNTKKIVIEILQKELNIGKN